MNKGYLRHIHACNLPLTEPLWPFFIADQQVGWMRPQLVQRIAADLPILQLNGEAIRLDPALDDFDSRSNALGEIAQWLVQQGVIKALMGEPYGATAAGPGQALATIDRTAAPYLGLRTFGQHINGYVRRDDGIWMWLGRRARDRSYFPGCLDQLAAGGLPYGLSLQYNLCKEAQEEAGISEQMAENAAPVGLVSYNRLTDRGFRSDILYCYDLELPVGFVPLNQDCEVEEFLLLPLEEVARLVRETDQFKLNCNLVVMDFLLRHSYISPEDPEYFELAWGLRMPPGLPSGVEL